MKNLLIILFTIFILYQTSQACKFTKLYKIYIIYYKDFPYKASYKNLHLKNCNIFLKKHNKFLRCKEEIFLLRDKKNLDNLIKIQQKLGYIILNIKEFGIQNAHAFIKQIQTFSLNFIHFKSQKPVIGIFKRHVLRAKSYSFKNLQTGKITRIKVTKNHRFYVANKHKFIPIYNISNHDLLLNAKNQTLKLICNHKIIHCGDALKLNNPIIVYNLEIYKDHFYYAGDDKILVHNVCQGADPISYDPLKEPYYEISSRNIDCESCNSKHPRFYNRDTLKSLITGHDKDPFTREGITSIKRSDGKIIDLTQFKLSELRGYEIDYERGIVKVINFGNFKLPDIFANNIDNIEFLGYRKSYYTYINALNSLGGLGIVNRFKPNSLFFKFQDKIFRLYKNGSVKQYSRFLFMHKFLHNYINFFDLDSLGL